MNDMLDTVIYAASFLIAIVFHEYAHGYAAYKLGDNTAKNMGRLTLNPIKHLDPLGLISMIVFKIGWAKGVPVNSANFRNRKRGMLIVSSAGILTNLGIAIIAAILFKVLPMRNEFSGIIFTFLLYLIVTNIILAVFNLIPVPPLDGSKILGSLLPVKYEYYLYKYEKYFYLVLIALTFSGYISRIINPLINLALRFLL